MVRNFEYRGCPLLGIEGFINMESHKERLLKLGFKNVEIEDMKTLYNKGTDRDELKRIEKLELLDEWEEWNLM